MRLPAQVPAVERAGASAAAITGVTASQDAVEECLDRCDESTGSVVSRAICRRTCQLHF
jgi:hypothetical protein